MEIGAAGQETAQFAVLLQAEQYQCIEFIFYAAF